MHRPVVCNRITERQVGLSPTCSSCSNVDTAFFISSERYGTASGASELCSCAPSCSIPASECIADFSHYGYLSWKFSIFVMVVLLSYVHSILITEGQSLPRL